MLKSIHVEFELHKSKVLFQMQHMIS